MSGEICCATVWRVGAFRSTPCRAKAKVERDGKWYCGTHDPVKRKAKQEERDAKWKKERDEQQAARDKAAAAAAEQKRRADCYEDLLEALQLLMSPIEGMQANLDAANQARAAIARATGETP